MPSSPTRTWPTTRARWWRSGSASGDSPSRKACCRTATRARTLRSSVCFEGSPGEPGPPRLLLHPGLDIAAEDVGLEVLRRLVPVDRVAARGEVLHGGLHRRLRLAADDRRERERRLGIELAAGALVDVSGLGALTALDVEDDLGRVARRRQRGGARLTGAALGLELHFGLLRRRARRDGDHGDHGEERCESAVHSDLLKVCVCLSISGASTERRRGRRSVRR